MAARIAFRKRAAAYVVAFFVRPVIHRYARPVAMATLLWSGWVWNQHGRLDERTTIACLAVFVLWAAQKLAFRETRDLPKSYYDSFERGDADEVEDPETDPEVPVRDGGDQADEHRSGEDRPSATPAFAQRVGPAVPEPGADARHREEQDGHRSAEDAPPALEDRDRPVVERLPAVRRVKDDHAEDRRGAEKVEPA